jgi:hypothetical protein
MQAIKYTLTALVAGLMLIILYVVNKAILESTTNTFAVAITGVGLVFIVLCVGMVLIAMIHNAGIFQQAPHYHQDHTNAHDQEDGSITEVPNEQPKKPKRALKGLPERLTESAPVLKNPVTKGKATSCDLC